MPTENKSVSSDTKNVPRLDLSEYGKLTQAFDFFNKELFSGKLSFVFVTIQRHAGAAGFFRAESFKERNYNPEEKKFNPPGFTVNEIAMMPEAMYGKTDREVLSTLVHEMCHHWQQESGKPSRKSYHNREWADKMEEVGLMPSSKGKWDVRNPDLTDIERKSCSEGTRTGQSMSHYIIRDGRFDRSCRIFLENDFAFAVHAIGGLEIKPERKKSKYKYTCSQCDCNAWVKPGLKLVCGDCTEIMEQEE